MSQNGDIFDIDNLLLSNVKCLTFLRGKGIFREKNLNTANTAIDIF
jgi:hypothetical protein